MSVGGTLRFALEGPFSGLLHRDLRPLCDLLLIFNNLYNGPLAGGQAHYWGTPRPHITNHIGGSFGALGLRPAFLSI